jgi:galactose-1-phosphate uridylyltransferase
MLRTDAGATEHPTRNNLRVVVVVQDDECWWPRLLPILRVRIPEHAVRAASAVVPMLLLLVGLWSKHYYYE